MEEEGNNSAPQPNNKHIQINEEMSKEAYISTIKALLTPNSTNNTIRELTLHGKGESIKKAVNIVLQLRNIFKDLHIITQLHTIQEENTPEIVDENISIIGCSWYNHNTRIWGSRSNACWASVSY